MGKIVIEVCAGTHCSMMGSMDIVSAIESLVELKESGVQCDIDIQMTPCMEICERGAFSPVVRIDGEVVLRAEAETIMSRLLDKSKSCGGQDNSPDHPASAAGAKGN